MRGLNTLGADTQLLTNRKDLFLIHSSVQEQGASYIPKHIVYEKIQ